MIPPRNPLERLRTPLVPPRPRSRRGHLHTKAAAEGRFLLQRCPACAAFTYPARDACPLCLGADLPLVQAPTGGLLLSETTIRVPADLYFRERTPWRIGLILLDCGPTLISHLHQDLSDGDRVRMSFRLDKSGNAAAFAEPEAPSAAPDRQLREFTADPQNRRILITNGRTAIGQEIAMALAAAGAALVSIGIAEPWKPFPGEARLRALPNTRLVPLDIGAEASVRNLAADIAGQTDILINTTDHLRQGGLLTAPRPISDEIDLTFRGFIHLATAFGPALAARAADGGASAVAWLNIFSVFALANWPSYGTSSAAEAASLSLSHCLRAELRPAGIRVINLFTGPLDTEWFQSIPPPKLAPRALAAAVIKSLRAGTEDVFVGDIAEDIRRRLESNPKALERELGQ